MALKKNVVGVIYYHPADNFYPTLRVRYWVEVGRRKREKEEKRATDEQTPAADERRRRNGMKKLLDE